jgi:tetratricopeptide (TPR) repeat protein
MKYILALCIGVLVLTNQQGSVIAQSPLLNVTSANLVRLVDRSKEKYNRRDFTGAMDDLNQAIKANPRYARAYNGRGLVKLAVNDLKGSMRDFDMAISLDPKYASAYNSRGVLRLSQRDFDNALIDFNSAINLDPNSADTYSNRGLIFIRLGKREAAIQNFQRSAQLYEIQGDKKSAREIQKAIKKLSQAKV